MWTEKEYKEHDEFCKKLFEEMGEYKGIEIVTENGVEYIQQITEQSFDYIPYETKYHTHQGKQPYMKYLSQMDNKIDCQHIAFFETLFKKIKWQSTSMDYGDWVTL